jgi:membrane-bound lytic murein transglycosylase MltF
MNKLTLTSTVHKLIEKNDMQRETDLKELNNNLVKLINVQERLVEIELMKIKLKYPDFQIHLEGDNSEA